MIKTIKENVYKLEYIWLDGTQPTAHLRSKTKIMKDFDEKKLPLMTAMINAILDNKKLIIKWEHFN